MGWIWGERVGLSGVKWVGKLGCFWKMNGNVVSLGVRGSEGWGDGRVMFDL